MKIKKKKEVKIEEPVIEKPIIKEEKPVVKDKKIAVKEEPVFCVVSAGDRISDIAKKFDITEEEIIKLNGTKDIVGGNVIRIK